MTQSSQTGQSTFLDISERAKFQITGTDRSRFLNGQITNDLRKASETVAIEACILNAKGKMNAHIFVSALGECFSVDAEPELRETLRIRLERYVIADDVQIEDVTDQFSLFHVLSEKSPNPEHDRIASVRRFAERGWDIWSVAAHRDAVLEQLSSAFVFLDSSCGRGYADRAGYSSLGSRTDGGDYSDRSQSGTTNDRLRKRLLHRPGSDLADENVGPDKQTAMRFGFAGRCPVPTRNETCLSLRQREEKSVGSRAPRAASEWERKSRSAT